MVKYRYNDSNKKREVTDMVNKKVLIKKMEERYDSIFDFNKRSRIPISLESCRTMLNEEEERVVSSPTLAVIMRYLDFTTNEIRHYLEDGGDNVIAPMLSNAENGLRRSEELLLGLFRTIESDRHTYNTILDMLQNMTKHITGIDWDNLETLKYKNK
jgi:hypothetical protein